MATRRRLPEIDDGRRVYVVVVCEERSAVAGVQVQKSTCEISFLLQVFHLWTTLFCLTFVSMKRNRQEQERAQSRVLSGTSCTRSYV